MPRRARLEPCANAALVGRRGRANLAQLMVVVEYIPWTLGREPHSLRRWSTGPSRKPGSRSPPASSGGGASSGSPKRLWHWRRALIAPSSRRLSAAWATRACASCAKSRIGWACRPARFSGAMRRPPKRIAAPCPRPPSSTCSRRRRRSSAGASSTPGCPIRWQRRYLSARAREASSRSSAASRKSPPPKESSNSERQWRGWVSV